MLSNYARILATFPSRESDRFCRFSVQTPTRGGSFTNCRDKHNTLVCNNFCQVLLIYRASSVSAQLLTPVLAMCCWWLFEGDVVAEVKDLLFPISDLSLIEDETSTVWLDVVAGCDVLICRL